MAVIKNVNGAPGGRPHGDRRPGAGRGPAWRHPPTAHRRQRESGSRFDRSRRRPRPSSSAGQLGGTHEALAHHRRPLAGRAVDPAGPAPDRGLPGRRVRGWTGGRVPASDALAELAPGRSSSSTTWRTPWSPSRGCARRRSTSRRRECVLLTLRMEALARRRLRGRRRCRALEDHASGQPRHDAARGRPRQRRAPLREPRGGGRRPCPLTARELEILLLAAEGHTNGQIARELWVTEQTVKFHLSNTYRKLGVANRTEASRYAHVHELVARSERLAS